VLGWERQSGLNLNGVTSRMAAPRGRERAYVRVILTSSPLVGFEGTVGDLADDYLLDEQDLIETVWHFALIGIIELPESVAGKDDLTRSTRLKLLTRSIYQKEREIPPTLP
jgi:hypothetical protein